MRTLLYVLGGVAGLGVLSFFTLRLAAPNVVIAGQKATERQAVAELRTLLWAQDRFIERYGRAGRLAELAGQATLTPPLSTSLLRPTMGTRTPAPGGAVVFASGYTFRVVVFDQAGRPVPDDAPVPPGATAWIGQAWPKERGASAAFSFCINGFEDILQSGNDTPGQGYDGARRVPAPDACVTPGAPRLRAGVGADGGQWSDWRGRRTRRSLAADQAAGAAGGAKR
ncbi:MAG: hypothetical protein H6706_16655 [Myxococcales bacterium]|nr:hypothetical protein [Myxococcales bacterium]